MPAKLHIRADQSSGCRQLIRLLSDWPVTEHPTQAYIYLQKNILKMKPLASVLLATLLSFHAHGKSHDYRKLRPALGLLSCGFNDSAAIRSNYGKLLAVDTLEYNEHLEIYYQDLAMACYKMSFVTKDKSYLEKDVSLLKKALAIDPGNETARWNCLFALFLLKRCDEANAQLTYYLRHTSKEHIDTAQVRVIRTTCP
jgi:tetratricopeptide (TPR) repeat protein